MSIGTLGCSHYFILGVLDVPNPQLLADALLQLRESLLKDPYFKGVPSMQPGARKTAQAFHAKDDLPEVRREVFALLQDYPVRFMAIVRNKHRVLEYVRQRNQRDAEYRYHQNELYERREQRYVELLRGSIGMVHDVDDTRHDQYGEYYGKRKPLTTAALGGLPGDIGSNSLS